MTAKPQASPPQSLYDAVGGEPTFHRIVARFYELVAVDEVLRPLYPERDLGAAEERLRLYLIEHWGGPAAYTQLRGPSRLAARHMRFRIARIHRDAWLRAMRVALDESGVAPQHRDRLWGHLQTVASNLTTHDTPSTLRMR
ncbi:MAG: hemoglobin [Solirubrobacteraceae bacterium]|nr:hemoglobin [Solirubrobacteraceae bacterium]